MDSRGKPITVADRLGSTLFIAALAHGVVILGVTFTADSLEEAEVLPSLNVTLVVNAVESEPPPDTELFAAQSTRGAGGVELGERPTTTPAAEDPRNQLGQPHGAERDAGEPEAEAELLAAREPAAPRDEATDPGEPADAAAMLSRTTPQTRATDVDVRAAAPKENAREFIATPSTRESTLAPYLESWRRRVERIGTINFPYELGTAEGRPTLEVAIAADGRLQDIVVRRSSGNAALDQAALTILRLAAPFQPLPDEIRRNYDVLRFAYEWEFLPGRRPPAVAAD